MQSIGKVIQYNGEFGLIQDTKDQVEFEQNDIQGQSISIGDIVVFRKEKRTPNIVRAKYITILKKEQKKED